MATINLNEELNSYQIRKEIGPVKASFEINNYMASKLSVRYLRAEGGYNKDKAPARWLRTLTVSSSYVSRV